MTIEELQIWSDKEFPGVYNIEPYEKKIQHKTTDYVWVTCLKPDCKLGKTATKKQIHRFKYKKNGCPKCNRNGHSNIMVKDAILKATKIHGSLYNYDNIYQISNVNTSIQIGCNRCLSSFKTTFHHHLYLGTGCPKCNGGKILTTEYFIKRCRDLHGDKYDYSNTKYKGLVNKIDIGCFTHGQVSVSASAHCSGSGCPKCNQSKGELWLIDIFNRNNIKFISDYTFDSCRNPDTGRKLRFDFYLPEYNIIVEFDGKQHSHFNQHFHQNTIKYNEYQIRDLIKDQHCAIKNILLIRVNHKKNIKILI